MRRLLLLFIIFKVIIFCPKNSFSQVTSEDLNKSKILTKSDSIFKNSIQIGAATSIYWRHKAYNNGVLDWESNVFLPLSSSYRPYFPIGFRYERLVFDGHYINTFINTGFELNIGRFNLFSIYQPINLINSINLKSRNYIDIEIGYTYSKTYYGDQLSSFLGNGNFRPFKFYIGYRNQNLQKRFFYKIGMSLLLNKEMITYNYTFTTMTFPMSFSLGYAF